MPSRDPRLTTSVALVAVAVWLGGLLALGAIVAPVVFTMIPRPEAADAMTVVFQRFDAIALGAVVVLLGSEAWRATGKAPIGRLDVARVAATAVGSALVLLEAFWITPAVVALHQGGAQRGVGAAGIELDRWHHLAETCGKAQVAFALGVIVLHVITLAPASRAADPARLSLRDESC